MKTTQKHLTGETEVQFLAFPFSLQGTLGPEAEEVIKFLKEAYGRKLERDAAPRDRASRKYRMTVFENGLRDEIAAAIARGVGEMQMSVGLTDVQTGRRGRANEMTGAGG